MRADAAGALLDTWAEVVGLLVLILLVVELIWLAARRRLDRARIASMAGSYSTLVPNLLLRGSFFAVWVVVAMWVWEHVTPVQLPTNPATILIGFLVADFSYYWYHRWSHEVNLLWASYHSVHHSSNTYETAVGFRISLTDDLFSGVFFLPAVLLGVHPAILLASIGLGLAFQGLIHTEMVPRLGWFDRWFNSPSNHRVHHGSNPEYLDRNYGSVLMVWDRVFGTYRPEVAQVVYGLTTPIQRNDPLTVHTWSLVELAGQLRRARGWRERLRHLFGHPGWTPAAGRADDPALSPSDGP